MRQRVQRKSKKLVLREYLRDASYTHSMSFLLQRNKTSKFREHVKIYPKNPQTSTFVNLPTWPYPVSTVTRTSPNPMCQGTTRSAQCSRDHCWRSPWLPGQTLGAPPPWRCANSCAVSFHQAHSAIVLGHQEAQRRQDFELGLKQQDGNVRPQPEKNKLFQRRQWGTMGFWEEYRKVI